MTLAPNDPRITAAIERAIKTYGTIFGVVIPRELVRAMIVRESAVPGSRPLVVDASASRREPDGRTSYGLMQVLNTTARDLGLTGDPTALFVPEVGIGYGVKYLAQQLKRYGGDVTKAVAAYNAGSARAGADGRLVNQPYVDYVLDWFKRFGGQLAVGSVGIVLLGLIAWALSRGHRAG